MGRPYDTTAFRALPRERCVVVELLGGECAGPIDRHHVIPISLGGDVDGRTVACCRRHHGALEALARRIHGTHGHRRCPHYHPTRAGREACERRLNASVAA